MEDIVAKHQTGAVIANEILADYEGLSQSVGRWLFGILKIYSEVRSIAK